MSFQILEILGSGPEGVFVRAGHQGRQIPVLIAGKGVDEALIGKSLEAEIGYDRILSWSVTADFEDASSGIWQAQDGIHLLGRVHNILDYGDGKIVVDVYVQNGPEVFAVDADEIDHADLESSDGLEITVGKLYIYPRT